MNTAIRNSALALAAAGLAIPAVPAAAADYGYASHHAAPAEQVWEHGRDRGKHKGWNKRGRDDRRYYSERDYYSQQRYYPSNYNQPAQTYYAEPVYRDTRVWRGNDNRYYCQRRDGTTGLIVGAAAGALLGREVDRRGDRTLGTILGAAAGAFIGKEVARGGCR